MSTPLPLESQTLFAELLQALRTHELERSFGHLSGGFAKKAAQRGEHWYFRTSEGAKGQQEFYIGPDSDDTRRLMEVYASARENAELEEANLQRMASMLRAGGILPVEPASAKVIHALGAAGLFRLGGVLVGTHAFLALGPLLGVRWTRGLHTQDIDLAAPRNLAVALPHAPMDVPEPLAALEMGFLPVPGLNPKAPTTSFKVRGKSLQVDLLTPAERGRKGPVSIPRFKAAAHPLPFLGFILEDAVDAAILGRGATLVRVPDPARFALHKLAVADQRPVIEQAKAQKDRAQAAEVLELLAHERPGDVSRALEALAADRGGWARRILRSARLAPALPTPLMKRLEKLQARV